MSKVLYKPKGKAGEYSKLAVNLYTGCSFGCTYCHAPRVLHKTKENFHQHVKPREMILKRLEADCSKWNGEKDSVLLCFTCDPYQPAEMEYKITRRAIEILHAHYFPVTILTKAGMAATRDFGLLSKRRKDSFATTLTHLDVDVLSKWEPEASSPQSRISSLEFAKYQDLNTWVSIEPVINPKESLKIIKITSEYVDEFKIGKLNYHPRSKEIDWKRFALEAVELCDKLGAKYQLKEDLKKYLEE